MTAYAVARLRDVRMNDEVLDYVRRVTGTIEAFGGWFVTHGKPSEQKEGAPSGQLVIVGFPTLQAARAWYDSDAYRAIARLRTSNCDSDLVLIEGVPPGYRASEILGETA